MADILSVTSLNLYVKSILDSNSSLNSIAVEGELSNFKKYPSGHCYFTLKDSNSSIKGVMFSSYVRGLNFMPENGMKVIVKGKVSLYERDGAYQIYVTNMFLGGAGAYQIAFEKLKEKLEKEGLFRQDLKKSLPAIPFKIGVATSAKGAAIHDIISVAQRRFPCVEIVVAPCMVQGKEAEPTIINAIKQLESIDDIELIIIARGGGSKEDLWVFNSESIARTAFACKKPTISAIGHEVDYSILDFVCDIRAATPTAAAELALPDIYSLKMQIGIQERSIVKNINSIIDNCKNRLLLTEKSEGFMSVKNGIILSNNKLKMLENSLSSIIENKIEILTQSVVSRSEILENQSPLNNLKKGYALIYKDNLLVKDSNLTVGDMAKIVTFNQEVECEVKKVRPREV